MNDPSIDAQVRAARPIADAVIAGLTTERGVHAETAVNAAARIAGTLLFRTFPFAGGNFTPGSPLLSDEANERGPSLVDVLTSALTGLGVDVDLRALPEPGPDHQPLIGLLQVQERLEPPIAAVARQHELAGEPAARACALAAALLIAQTRQVLDPAIGVALAVEGFVEATKTVPLRGGAPAGDKPWYKLW